MSETTSPIKQWYSDRTIFITGGTGFMGKVLVEKLLYSCWGVKRIYVLMRDKRGKTPEERVADMWKLAMFDRLRKVQPDAVKKIVPVVGVLDEEDLGLNISDIDRLTNEVSVVFHIAATLKQEAPLKEAVEQNVNGTARVVELSKRIQKLKAFLHFSTTFCSADFDVFEEKVYEPKHDPQKIIDMTTWMSPEALNLATPPLIAPHPNTYTFTKRLAETVVSNAKDDIPVCIIRPSIVIPAVAEPIPGWVDNLNGPVGILTGAAKGIIRSIKCSGKYRAQCIPVDHSINTSIVVGYLVGTGQTKTKPGEVPVYNLTTDEFNPLIFKDVAELGRQLTYKYPFEMTIWYPNSITRSSAFIHNIYSFLFHRIPAIIIDLLMLICGQKMFMMKLYRKIYEGTEALSIFATRSWKFRCENFLGLEDQLTEEEKKLFPMKTVVPLREYLLAAIFATRQYVLHEDLSSIPRCRRNLKILYIIDKLTQFGFYYYIFYLLTYFTPVKYVNDLLQFYLSYIPFLGHLFISAK